MDNVEQLIKKLQEAKEELIKAEEAAKPKDSEAKTISIGKHTNGKFKGYNWAAGKIQMHPGDFDTHEEAKAHFEGKGHLIKADTVRPDAGYGKVTVKDTTPKPVNGSSPYGKVIVKAEELEKDSANPALAPKDVKIKELQTKIDAGQYKPDASKIAGKMLQKEELTCSENGQWNLKPHDDEAEKTDMNGQPC